MRPVSHRYFTEDAARALIGRRVQARVALSRYWLRDFGLWIGEGHQGAVTHCAFGPEPDKYLVGVHWDDPQPAEPRYGPMIDWYTEEEFHALIGRAVDARAA
ncbi:MAG: hypothetical protein ACREU9_01535 [Gammaproteobacteria bacterium]